MLDPHMEYIKKVDLGETPFRNSSHMTAVMLSNTLNLKFTEEEEALKKTLRDIVDLKEVFLLVDRNLKLTMIR